MARTASTSGEVEYVSEGYVLRWGPDGLEIQATDYHCTKLRLTWQELMELARRSGWTRDEREMGAES
jgi:hypothetical protein